MAYAKVEELKVESELRFTNFDKFEKEISISLLVPVGAQSFKHV